MYGELSGQSSNALSIVNAANNTTITVENSSIYAINNSYYPGGQQVTIGAYAADNGTIYLINSPLTIVGEHPVPTKETGSGQVIITP